SLASPPSVDRFLIQHYASRSLLTFMSDVTLLVRRGRQYASRLHARRVRAIDPALPDCAVDRLVKLPLIVVPSPVQLEHLRPVERNLVAHVPAVREVLVVGGGRDVQVGTADAAEGVAELVPGDGGGGHAAVLHLNALPFRGSRPMSHPFVEVAHGARHEVVNRKIAHAHRRSATERKWP